MRILGVILFALCFTAPSFAKTGKELGMFPNSKQCAKPRGVKANGIAKMFCGHNVCDGNADSFKRTVMCSRCAIYQDHFKKSSCFSLERYAGMNANERIRASRRDKKRSYKDYNFCKISLPDVFHNLNQINRHCKRKKGNKKAEEARFNRLVGSLTCAVRLSDKKNGKKKSEECLKAYSKNFQAYAENANSERTRRLKQMINDNVLPNKASMPKGNGPTHNGPAPSTPTTRETPTNVNK